VRKLRAAQRREDPVNRILGARQQFAILAAALISLTAQSSEVQAHAGHDHGPVIEVSASVAPRFEAASEDFEILAVLKGADLILTLDRFRTNEPITNAKIEVAVNGEAATVTTADEGTYKVVSAMLGKPGRAEVLLTIQAGSITDLLAGAIVIPGATADPVRAASWWQRWPITQASLVAALGGVMLGVLGMLLVRTRSLSFQPDRPADVASQAAVGQAAASQAAVMTDDQTAEPPKLRGLAKALPVSVLLAGISLSMTPAPAAHAETPAKASITISADLPQRLADGSLFVPKITQRLLAIRTVMAGESTAGSTIELNGQIIADPNGFGRVQATVDGRIDAPKGGLVVVGQTVERGQALAILTPIVATADRSSFESASGEIDTRIALGEAKLARLTRIAGVVAQKDIDDIRTELETLKTRRAAVRSAVRETMTLTAPISGTVSLSTAVPGQLANARETLFEIVDLSRLWVEAIAFDARLVADITAARAVEATGEILALDYVGRGVSARQQGLPLHFSVKAPPATLVIGKTVNVLLTTRETRQGMILPQSAVVKGQNGLAIVWTHIQAERFKPNIVKVKPIDGQRLLVEGGLSPNERVVIEGATLLNQVR
jgi:membrane fusion protein, heavy metal efflux system